MVNSEIRNLVGTCRVQSSSAGRGCPGNTWRWVSDSSHRPPAAVFDSKWSTFLSGHTESFRVGVSPGASSIGSKFRMGESSWAFTGESCWMGVSSPPAAASTCCLGWAVANCSTKTHMLTTISTAMLSVNWLLRDFLTWVWVW